VQQLETEVESRQTAADNGEVLTPLVLIIDDLDVLLLSEPPALSRLADIARGGRLLEIMLVVAGLNQEIRRIYHSFTEYLRADHRGFLLCPDLREDGDILDLRLPAMGHRTFPPGRGFFVHKRTWFLVQTAIPEAIRSAQNTRPPGTPLTS
jgi:hypothetical protein